MARKASVPPSPAQLTPQQVRASIPKLERRAAELRALDVDRLTETTYVDVLEDLRRRIDDTLVEIYGHDTIDYRRYAIGGLDDTPIIMFGGPTYIDQRRPAIRSAVASAISTLCTASLCDMIATHAADLPGGTHGGSWWRSTG
jgi:hypothetical protein